MDEFKTPSCVYNHRIICGSRKCDSCGWNPDVIEKRKRALRLMGKEALAANPEGLDELYAVKYILRNCKDFGGEMIHTEMQKNLGIGYPQYSEEKKKAKSIVRNLIMEAIECM